MNIIKSQGTGKIKVCTPTNACIEADGKNAQRIVGAVVFAIVCVGLYYLSKSR